MELLGILLIETTRADGAGFSIAIFLFLTIALAIYLIFFNNSNSEEEDEPLAFKKDIIIQNYKGSEKEANEMFQKDAIKMAKMGYYPTSQTWLQGSWGCGSFIVAFLLCFIFIGIIVFIYMLIVKPEGSLSVVYELSEQTEKGKECPICFEIVKEKAIKCRFCQHEFETVP